MVITEASVEISEQITQRRKTPTKHTQHIHGLMLVCLFVLGVFGVWFAYQFVLVPHTTGFAPDWQGARWIQAADGNNSVAYFRYTTTLKALPESAFITVTASQVFRIYVNGTFIGTSSQDFLKGNFPKAYIYDINSALQPGRNVIAVRVMNVDGQIPALRASFGMRQDGSLYYYKTGQNSWQATIQSGIVHPRYAKSLDDWANLDYDASAWLTARVADGISISPMLTVNPMLYKEPLPVNWMSAGAGYEAYFVRTISLPAGVNDVWMRLAVTGTAEIIINGHVCMVWNGAPSSPPANVVDYLSEDQSSLQYRAGLVIGVSDISTYLHPGVNTIALHVTAPGASAAEVGLDNLSAALAIDLLLNAPQGQTRWLQSSAGWYSSNKPVDNWAQASHATLAWHAPILIGHPDASHPAYLADNENTPRNVQVIPFFFAIEVIFMSAGAVILLWLLMSLLLRRYYRSWRLTLETLALAYLPAIACEGVLLVLAREPQMPQPFPYTWPWALVLLMFVVIGYVFLWLNAISREGEVIRRSRVSAYEFEARRVLHTIRPPKKWSLPVERLWAWVRLNWPLLSILFVAILLISYRLTYEPYWQDELTSYFAAKGILSHGIPVLPSGSYYAKGELYSYMLALSMLIFGEQGGALRYLSIAEYLVSIGLLYYVGGYFFNRRIALLATAMLAFSPISLVWGQQVRMYEQAQLMSLLVIYLSYRAMQEREKVYRIYLAAGCFILAYFSCEETIILLPGLVLCVVLMSRDKTHPAFAILRQKHWWIAAVLGGSAIGAQLLIAYISNFSVLGPDQSQPPLIQLTADNIPFYLHVLFYPSQLGNGTFPLITFNSILATIGCIWAIRSQDRRAKFCAWLLVISFITLVLLFTLPSYQYIYVLLPIYYLIGAYALILALRILWRFVRPRIALPRGGQTTDSMVKYHLSKPVQLLVVLTLGMIYFCVIVFPILPLSNYNLFISQQVGFSYHRHSADYDAAGQYMQQHWQQGDIVISVSPAISILYYVKHVNYYFSVNRAQSPFESEENSIDRSTGATALLNQQDFQSILAAHARIWIISDDAFYQAEATHNHRFVFPPDFHLVYEGYGSAIYFRGS